LALVHQNEQMAEILNTGNHHVVPTWAGASAEKTCKEMLGAIESLYSAWCSGNYISHGVVEYTTLTCVNRILKVIGYSRI